jgi:rare lipoprotein A
MQRLIFQHYNSLSFHLAHRTAILFGVCCIAALSACSSSVRFASTSPNGAESRSVTVAKPSRTPAPERASGEHNSSELKTTDHSFSGMASYYGNEFQGRKTASGERYDRSEFSAAHRSLPFGTMLKIRNKANDRTVIVRVNDRGPFKETRILDLSLAAAQELDLVKSGTANIEATVVEVQ